MIKILARWFRNIADKIDPPIGPRIELGKTGNIEIKSFGGGGGGGGKQKSVKIFITPDCPCGGKHDDR